MKLVCKVCRRGHLVRSHRRGFMERFIYSLQGKYPWRCKECKARVFLPARDSSEVVYLVDEEAEKNHRRAA